MIERWREKIRNPTCGSHVTSNTLCFGKSYLALNLQLEGKRQINSFRLEKTSQLSALDWETQTGTARTNDFRSVKIHKTNTQDKHG